MRAILSIAGRMVITQIAVSMVLLVGALLRAQLSQSVDTDRGIRERGITIGFFHSSTELNIKPQDLCRLQRQRLIMCRR